MSDEHAHHSSLGCEVNVMDLSKTFGGKKFMWDGRAYPGRQEAEEGREKYSSDGFDVELIEDGGHCFLFTRRVVQAAGAEK